MTTSRQLRGQTSDPALIILSLSLSIAVGLGIGRFAYSLVLPDMRDSLGWSYSTAGFMNTVNAVGYLAGALGASRLVRRIGAFNAVWLGMLICLAALALSAVSGHVVPFSAARAALGVGAAFSLVGGGALTATIAQANPSRAAVLLSLFYVGPAIGIIVSGLVSPFVLERFGEGSWWLVWVVLTALSAALALVIHAYRVETPPPPRESAAAYVALRPILACLAGYFLFGAGYIAYMTFMIAYVRDAGGGALAQSAFWCTIGLGAFVSPWIWRGLIERSDSGVAMAVLMAMTTVGAALPMFGDAPVLLAASALVFGIAFFAVVTATTAFVRFNYRPAAWPQAIAVMTISFSLGQTLGPFVTGAITDALGSLFYALVASAGALGLGAMVAACQRRLVPAPE